MEKSYSTRAVALWLFFCAASVFCMALIGAVTRLTESGLSIVEWKPVTGALPPLDMAGWQREFELYQQSPQYQKVNAGMTLAEFKNIYFWEWIHRLWGRLIGLFYLLPFLWFWKQGRLPRDSMPAFLGVLALGFLQGGMGWYMVKSGLVDTPAVSHYRLAAHLMLAFLIYGCLFRLGLAFALAPEKDAARVVPLRRFIRAALVLAALVMTWGAFVAGLDAGMVYNTFPMMNGYWFPPEMLQYSPVWQAFFEEPATVQFTHRVLALLLLVKISFLVWKSFSYHPPQRIRRLFIALGAVTVAQGALGIATLLTQVHLHVAVMHQAGALAVLTVLVWLLHEIPNIREGKV